MTTPDGSIPVVDPPEPLAVSETEAPGAALRRNLIRLVLSLLIAVVCVLVLRRLDLRLVPSAQELATVNWKGFATFVAVSLVYHFVRAIRLRHLLDPIAHVSRRRILSASWLGFAGIMLMPLRTGEVIRPLLLREKGRISFSAALGTMGAERVVDGLVVTAALAVALLFVPRLPVLPPEAVFVPKAAYGALVVFVVVFALMAAFYVARDRMRALTMATVGRVSSKLAHKVAHVLEGVGDGLGFLGAVRYSVPFLLETALYWALNAVSFWLLGNACGLHMTYGHAVAVMGVLAVGILVPAGPGLFGVFQGAAYAGLLMYFPRPEVQLHGMLFVFLLYIANVGWHVTTAASCLLFDRKVLAKRPSVRSGLDEASA